MYRSYSILTSAIDGDGDGGEWSASRPRASFTAGERTLAILCSPEPVDAEVGIHSLPFRGWARVVQFTVDHYTAWATPAQTLTNIERNYASEDGCLLGRWTVKSDKNWQTFQKYLLPPIIRAIMEPLNSPEKLINFYLYTRRNIPEHVHLQFVAEIYEMSTTYLSRKFLAGTWAKLWNNLVRLCQWVKLPTEIALMAL